MPVEMETFDYDETLRFEVFLKGCHQLLIRLISRYFWMQQTPEQGIRPTANHAEKYCPLSRCWYLSRKNCTVRQLYLAVQNRNQNCTAQYNGGCEKCTGLAKYVPGSEKGPLLPVSYIGCRIQSICCKHMYHMELHCDTAYKLYGCLKLTIYAT